MRKEAQRLIDVGKMPTLQALSAAVLEARKLYANQIRRARREGTSLALGSDLKCTTGTAPCRIVAGTEKMS